MQVQAHKESKENKRQPLPERIRAKLHERFYGDLPGKEGKDQKSEADKPDEVKK